MGKGLPPTLKDCICCISMCRARRRELRAVANLSNYEFDVFVSYADVDNQPFSPAEHGWVSVLVENFGHFLARQLGRREAFSIWFAPQNTAPRRVSHIPEQAKRSAVFLAVLSPGYVASEWCLRELQAFVDSHEGEVDKRLFVVEHMPLGEHHKMPEYFHDLRRYRFFRYENKILRILGFPKPLHDEREYFDKVYDVAHDIAEILTLDPPSQPSRATVLLAEVTDDLESRRDEVVRYLDQAGIAVLPKHPYRLVREEFEHALVADLAKSSRFVQLLGSVPGKRPPDIPNGFGWLQFELAKQSKLQILQWRSPDLDLSSVDSALQRRLLEQDTVRAMPIVEFMQTVVKGITDPPPSPPQRPSDSMIFINADPVDEGSAHGIKDRLGDRVGWLMPLSLHDGKAQPEDLQQDMESNFINADGLFIVYGAVGPLWVRSQLKLYQKLAPRRPAKPRFLAIVEDPPGTKAPLGISLPGLVTIGIDRITEVAFS
jgi:hypothetical protein